MPQRAQSADSTATLPQRSGGRLFVAVIGRSRYGVGAAVAIGVAAYGVDSLACSRHARV